MRKFVCEPITREEEKELCFVMRNGKTEEERNHAMVKLVYSYEKKVFSICCKTLKIIYGEKINLESKDIDHLMDICFEVLIQYADKFNPNHSSGANLLTYARRAIDHALLMECNKGMTETQVRNFNTIYAAQKKYEKIHNTKWYETEASLNELSYLCGLSVKVIKNTLLAKRENIYNTLSLNDTLGEDSQTTLEDTIEDKRYSLETEYENRKYRNILNSFTEFENAIFYTWVDKDTYDLLSEREGIRRLAKMGYSIGRGTLNNRRKALKIKIQTAMYDTAA